jgi:hypothetical protein
MTVNIFAFIGAGGAVNEATYSQITNIFQTLETSHPRQTYLLEGLYGGLSLIKAPSLITVC